MKLDKMTKVKIVPVEPTNKMINKAINVPIPLVLLDSIPAVQSLKFTTKYKAALDEAPDPTENAELVERAARWLLDFRWNSVVVFNPLEFDKLAAEVRERYIGYAKGLIKVIQEGKE